MIFPLTTVLLLLFSIPATKSKSCNDIFYTETNALFLAEFLNWRHLNHFIIIDEKIKSVCCVKFVKDNHRLFNTYNLFTSMRPSTRNLEATFSVESNKILTVMFARGHKSTEEFIEQVNNVTQYGGDRSALLILMLLNNNQTNLLDSLRFATFGIDADLTLAFPFSDNNNTKIQMKQKTIFLTYPENDNTTSYSLENYCQNEEMKSGKNVYCLIQVYKIRKNYSSSLIIYPLGFWDADNSTWKDKNFLLIEKRTNFHQLPLIGGTRNSTFDKVGDQTVTDAVDDDIVRLKEFYLYFINFFNSSELIKYYTKLGTKDTDGDWKDLLGGVVKEDIDIGVDNTVRNAERIDDMYFSHEIMRTMRNIYVRPEESNEIRNIFLQPFDSRLIFCVLGTGFLFALVMTFNNKFFKDQDPSAFQNTRFMDSLIWCIGVFTQQGSILRPNLFHGQMVVLISLAFTLLIYNSYSAFITSVLSVELTNIRTVDDLLKSDYEIGYTKNSKDEVYLRSTNITQLNEIYLRGYLHNNISNVTEGLLKASRGNYGFFASVQSARKELLNITSYKCLFDIDEIPIKYTSDSIGFAMALRSPYKRLVDLSIIRMYETGVYKYIISLIIPKMPTCEKRKTYQSARLPDLTTAFCLPLAGIAIGIFVVIMECIWNKRKVILTNFRKKYLQTKKKDGDLNSKRGPLVAFTN